MEAKTPQYDVGVLVGRFQVHELHDGHRELLDYVRDKHWKVIIVLGLSPVTPSLSNPLDFEARKQMLLDYFPEANVVYLNDCYDDELWSTKLDRLIVDLRTASQSVVLYGGRDSFINHYTGVFDTVELTQSDFWSGSAVRKQIARSATRSSADFRAGVIWATSARFPTAYQTVDVAILKETGSLLLGRKPGQKLWRFIGGFSDPQSETLEADARREVMEETGVEVNDVTYIASTVVDDWRYRGEADCIKTALFRATYVFGHPTPNDDIEEVKWFPFSRSNLNRELDNQLVPEHRPLMAMLRAHFINNKEMH